MASRTFTLKKLLVFNSILFIPVIASQKTDYSQIYIKRIKQIIMNKVQAATHDNNQYKIISTNATDLRVAAEIEGEFEHKKEILDIIDLIQKKHKNEQEEEEEQTSHKKGKNEDKNKKESEKEDEEDENDSDEDSDAEDSDSDDDDDKSGGILIPIFEWVKGIIPRVIPTPQS